MCAACVAAPGTIGRRVGGTAQPGAHLVLSGLLALLDLGHEAADAGRWIAAGGAVEMAARLAPQAGIERRLGQRQMAFDVGRVLAGQPAHDADPLQRFGLARGIEIERCEIGMRRQRPAALDRLHRLLRVARLELQLGEAPRHGDALRRQCERIARQRQRVAGAAFALGLAAALDLQQGLQGATLVGA